MRLVVYSYTVSPHIRFVAFILESPVMMHFDRFEEFSDFFNWTMSYRQDSDIVAPYGIIKPICEPARGNFNMSVVRLRVFTLTSPSCKTASFVYYSLTLQRQQQLQPELRHRSDPRPALLGGPPQNGGLVCVPLRDVQ